MHHLFYCSVLTFTTYKEQSFSFLLLVQFRLKLVDKLWLGIQKGKFQSSLLESTLIPSKSLHRSYLPHAQQRTNVLVKWP